MRKIFYFRGGIFYRYVDTKHTIQDSFGAAACDAAIPVDWAKSLI